MFIIRQCKHEHKFMKPFDKESMSKIGSGRHADVNVRTVDSMDNGGRSSKEDVKCFIDVLSCCRIKISTIAPLVEDTIVSQTELSHNTQGLIAPIIEHENTSSMMDSSSNFIVRKPLPKRVNFGHRRGLGNKLSPPIRRRTVSRRSVIRGQTQTVGILSIVYLVSYSPKLFLFTLAVIDPTVSQNNLLELLNLTDSRSQELSFYTISDFCITIRSFLNPIIYLLISRSVRNEFTTLLHACMCYCCRKVIKQANPSSQSITPRFEFDADSMRSTSQPTVSGTITREPKKHFVPTRLLTSRSILAVVTSSSNAVN